jgi:hypothetical protein
MERYILFPGRHHVLTLFQAEYLGELAGDGATVVWAVTSASHENTKRNPVPYDRREAAIERFGMLEGLRSLVVPVFDTAYTDRFAEVTLKNIAATLDLSLEPANTVVACSTPEVADLYRRLGFAIAGVEASRDRCRPGPGTCCSPWPPATRAGPGWPTRRRWTCSSGTAWWRTSVPS